MELKKVILYLKKKCPTNIIIEPCAEKTLVYQSTGIFVQFTHDWL